MKTLQIEENRVKKLQQGQENDMLIHQYVIGNYIYDQIVAEQICIFRKNSKEGLPIVLQEWQRLNLIKAILCATWKANTKEELCQAKYFLTRDLPFEYCYTRKVFMRKFSEQILSAKGKKILTFNLPETTAAKEVTPRTTEAEVIIGPLYSVASTCFSSK